MKVYAETKKDVLEFAQPTAFGHDIIRVPSDTTPGKYYTVDITHGRCDCPAWKFQKGGIRNPCKHLKRFDFKPILPDFKEVGVGVKEEVTEAESNPDAKYL